MNKQENQLVTFLVEKYKPNAIILHGSRAQKNLSYNTSASDWDFFIIGGKNISSGRTEINNLLCDITVLPRDLGKDSVLLSRGVPNIYVKILYENPKGFTSEIIKNTKAAYKAGPLPLSKIEITNRKYRLKALVEKAEKNPGIPELAASYIGEAYSDPLFRFWYEFRNEWPKSIGVAITDIKNRDPKYFKLLQVIANESEYSTKIKALREIYKKLF